MLGVRCVAVVTALSCFILGAHAATPPPPGWASEVDALIAAEMKRRGIPGAQIAIAEHGQVIYSRGYGVADIGSGREVSAGTLFQVGSVAKAYTGMLLAELAAEGRVDLEAPLSRHVTELQGRPTGTATVHQLLTHSAGWIDTGQPFGRTDAAALDETLKRVPDDWVLTAAGRVFSYSNGGFAMAGYVAERATGTPFLQLMDERVLGKVSRDHATWQPLVAMTYDFSQGHGDDPQKGVVVQRPVPSNSAEYPAGFLYVTAADVVRFGAALMSGGKLDGKQVFAPGAVERVTGKYIPIPGTPHNRSGYGLQIDSVGGERVWRKSGSVPGFASELSMWPDRQLAIAVSINRLVDLVPNQLTLRIAQQVYHVGVAPPPLTKERASTPAERAELAGRYRVNAALSMEIAEHENQLEFRGQRGTFPMVFLDKDRVLIKAPAPIGRELIVLRDEKGEVEYLHSRSRAWAREKNR